MTEKFTSDETNNRIGAEQYAAVILAAGYSSRMKEFKPLLPVGKTTAVERIIDSAKAAGIEKILVVTGHNRDAIKAVIEAVGGVAEAFNGGYDAGMFSSIKVGLRHVEELWGGNDGGSEANSKIEGVFLMPVDCPLVSSGVLSELMERAGEDAAGGSGRHLDCFYVPVFEGKKGHPLLIPYICISEICRYEGGGGLKAVTDKYWDKMVRLSTEEEGCLLDMDTPEGYMDIQKFLEGGCKREPLEEMAKGRRIFLVRHGETRRHAEKMFIGRYDVPLEEGAEEKIRAAADMIIEELLLEKPDNAETLRIYTSPLKRSVQTAEIIRDMLAEKEDFGGEEEPELCIVEDFQEISLGAWDGKPVREIREKYPEEYDRRGENIFLFKTGNKAENFYDVQYRAVNALRDILAADKSRDILIVSHSAVIRALENNVKGLRVDSPWKPVEKAGFIVATVK